MPQVATPPAGAVRQETLYCQAGGSDKVYQIGIYRSGGGYVVMAYNGRRLARSYTERIKSHVTTLDDANAIFSRLYWQKRDKGYLDGQPIGAGGLPGARANLAAPSHYVALQVLPADRPLAILWAIKETTENSRWILALLQALKDRGFATSLAGGRFATLYTADLTRRSKADLKALEGTAVLGGRAYKVVHIEEPLNWDELVEMANNWVRPFQDPDDLTQGAPVADEPHKGPTRTSR